MASFIFIRHGRTTLSDRTGILNKPSLAEERSAPLADGEPARARQLRSTLVQRNIEPQYVLSSSWLHSVQTAVEIAGESVPVIEVTALTLRTPGSEFSLQNVREAGVEAGIDWTSAERVALIGHEPRLSQLATMMTGESIPRLARLSAGIVSGDSCEDMLARVAKTTREVVGVAHDVAPRES